MLETFVLKKSSDESTVKLDVGYYFVRIENKLSRLSALFNNGAERDRGVLEGGGREE